MPAVIPYHVCDTVSKLEVGTDTVCGHVPFKAICDAYRKEYNKCHYPTTISNNEIKVALTELVDKGYFTYMRTGNFSGYGFKNRDHFHAGRATFDRFYNSKTNDDVLGPPTPECRFVKAKLLFVLYGNGNMSLGDITSKLNDWFTNKDYSETQIKEYLSELVGERHVDVSCNADKHARYHLIPFLKYPDDTMPIMLKSF